MVQQIDFGPIDAATRELARGLQPGPLVVYETTLPVGTTRDRFGPMLEAGSRLHLDRDLFLAFSPERVLVGRVLLDLRRYPKIVGGVSAEGTRRAVEFYRSALDEGTEVRAVANSETAEMTKLAETTYRKFASTNGIPIVGSYNPTVVGCKNTDFRDWVHPLPRCTNLIASALKRVPPSLASQN